jgi:hypothetical protein
MTIKRKPVRLLTNLKISEVSAVDRGAGEGCHVLMRKRDGKPDYEAFFGRIFGVKKRHMDGYPPELCKNLDVPVGGPNEPINPGGDDSDGTRVERGFGDKDDEAAQVDEEMDTDEDGGAGSGDEGNAGGESTDQLERAESAMKETTMKLMDIAKRYGWRAVCKHFVVNGTSGVSSPTSSPSTPKSSKSSPSASSDDARRENAPRVDRYPIEASDGGRVADRTGRARRLPASPCRPAGGRA